MSPELRGCWADALSVSVCEMLYGALMKGDTMQRWQRVISLCWGWFICVFVCLLSVTETGRRCHSDRMSITGRAGVCFMNANSVLPFFSSLLCSSLCFISLSPSVHLHADGGVGSRKWVGGGRSWPSSLPLHLSVCPSNFIFPCLSFWWGFESLWRMGMFSPPVMDWGWT